MAKKKTRKKKKSSKKISYKISLEKMLEAGCHFGHQSRRWHPNMEPFIWKEKEGIHVFDLPKTADLLEKACLAIQKLVKKGGEVIFIGTKRQAQEIIKKEAERAGSHYIVNRWLGGTITNWRQIKKSIDKLIEMEEKNKKGEYEKYTKKENVLIEREIARLKRFFEGVVGLKDIPDALYVIDVKKEIAAVKEAKKKGVKVFAIVDSNVDPDLVDYVIPANDDAVQSIKVITEKIADAVKFGKKLRKS